MGLWKVAISELGRVVTSVPFGTGPDQGQMKCIRGCSQRHRQLAPSLSFTVIVDHFVRDT